MDCSLCAQTKPFPTRQQEGRFNISLCEINSWHILVNQNNWKPTVQWTIEYKCHIIKLMSSLAYHYPTDYRSWQVWHIKLLWENKWGNKWLCECVLKLRFKKAKKLQGDVLWWKKNIIILPDKRWYSWQVILLVYSLWKWAKKLISDCLQDDKRRQFNFSEIQSMILVLLVVT